MNGGEANGLITGGGGGSGICGGDGVSSDADGGEIGPVRLPPSSSDCCLTALLMLRLFSFGASPSAKHTFKVGQHSRVPEEFRYQ